MNATKDEIKKIQGLRVKFPCIYVWGKEMQSFDYYIVRQMEQAERDNAPRSAIYERDGVWVTAEEIKNSELRVRLMDALSGVAS